MAGAWNLHTLSLEDELDVFALFSSGSSLIGIPSQGNYAAGNAFLDALALHRRAAGLSGLSVNWGAIEDVGYLIRHPALRSQLNREGVGSITAAEACAALDRALRHDVTRIAVARIDGSRWSDDAEQTRAAGLPSNPQPSADLESENRERDGLVAQLLSCAPAERRDLLESQLARYAAQVLATEEQRVDLNRPLTDMGVDSLMAVELQMALRRDLGVEPALVEMLGGATIRNLVDGLLEQISLDSALS